MPINETFPWSVSERDGHIRNAHGEIILRTPRWVGLETTRMAAAAPELAKALRLLIEWHGRRGGPNDELLPIDQQDPEMQQAMRALAEVEG